MDDPQLQRAIYASIQTARSQGYNIGSGKGTAQSFRPSLQPARGGGRGIGSLGASTHRSTVMGATRGVGNGHRNQAQRSQPHSYVGNSLPGMGFSSAAAATTGGTAADSLRTSFGRIEALRRDGIVPASAGPITSPPTHHAQSYQAQSLSRANSGGGAPSNRPLPTAVPRVASSPQRLRNQPQQGQLSVCQRPGQLQVVHSPTTTTIFRSTNPVLDAIAAVTAEAHAALDSPYPPPTTTVIASPITATPLSPSPGSSARWTQQPSVRKPTGTAAAGGCGGLPPSPSSPSSPSPPSGGLSVSVPLSSPTAVAAPVGGVGPPPRTLMPVASPSGGVVLVPEGLDPVLVQMVVRDAVTWDTDVTFDDIAGCERAKQLLHEAVALPLIIPEFFTGIREPWRGVLLHGPPGNGKTLLAKAVAKMVGGAFFAVSPSSLTSKWRGESEKLLATLFAVAQAHAPAIIFIDEVDALGGARGGEGEHEASRRFKAELLQQMDGLASGRGVMVLAATNCPWDLDPALRRRLEKRIHIGLPDTAQRLALLQLHLRGVALAPDVDLAALAAVCEGYSGADIRLLCRDAAMSPLRRQLGGLALSTSASSSPCIGPQNQQHLQQNQQQPHQALSCSSSSEPCPAPQAAPLTLRSAADIRRLADSGELARGAVVSAADLKAARGAVRPSVGADQAVRYVQWDQQFAST